MTQSLAFLASFLQTVINFAAFVVPALAAFYSRVADVSSATTADFTLKLMYMAMALVGLNLVINKGWERFAPVAFLALAFVSYAESNAMIQSWWN